MDRTLLNFFSRQQMSYDVHWFYSPRVNYFRSGLEGNGRQFIQTIGSLLLVIGYLPFVEMNRLTVVLFYQCSDGHFDPLPDIFLSWWLANIMFYTKHFLCIEPCRTKCLAMSEPSTGHQQKSVRHVPHIRKDSIIYNWLLECWALSINIFPRSFLITTGITASPHPSGCVKWPESSIMSCSM